MILIKTGTKYLNRCFYLLMLAFMAIGIHILYTFKINGIDIRIASTDLLIPVFIVYIIIMLIKTRKIPDVILDNIWKWLIVISIWMLISFINGYYYIGTFYLWAFINKFSGWFNKKQKNQLKT